MKKRQRKARGDKNFAKFVSIKTKNFYGYIADLRGIFQ